MATSTTEVSHSVVVQKPNPYTFDLGNLAVFDPNPLPKPDNSADLESTLTAVARDGAQAFVNQILLQPIQSTPSGILVSLPTPSSLLPRSKPLPTPAPPTKWERFAAKKGIKPKTREQRRNITFNSATGKWERKWGKDAANKVVGGGLGSEEKGSTARETDWLVEIPEKDWKKDIDRAAAGKSLRAEGRRERKEKVKRNERAMRRNIRIAEENKK